MKKFSYLGSFLITLFSVSLSFGQLELPRGSSHALVSQTVGLTQISVEYYRPTDPLESWC